MKKCITPVIAIVLLLLITVGISTVTFFWVSSLQMRTQASPTSTVTSITQQGSDRLKLISVSDDGITVQDTSGENISDTVVLVNGIEMDVNHTQEGQFHIWEWDPENITPLGDTDLDIIIGKSLLSYIIGEEEGDEVFAANCGNGWCMPGKESPNTCPLDCDVINVTPLGGGARLSPWPFNNVHYLDLKYTTYDGTSLIAGNWSPSQTIVTSMNASEIDVAYDNYNRPVVFFARRKTEGTPKYYNLSYTFWNGTGWTPEQSIMTDFNNSYLGYLFLNVDVFNNDTAIFAWFNQTSGPSHLAGPADIYYAIGNATEMSAPQIAFSVENITGLSMRVDNNDRVVMIWGVANKSETSNTTALYYSKYDPVEASWSNPKEIMRKEDSGSYIYAAPIFAFNSTNHGTLLFAEFDETIGGEGSVNIWLSTWMGYDFTTPVSIYDKFQYAEVGLSIPQMAYGGTNKAVILYQCNATKFNDSYSKWGLCFSTYDGETFSNKTLVQGTEFDPDAVVVSPELLVNKHGSIVGTWCAYSSTTSYSMFVSYWNEFVFSTPQTVETNLPENPESSCPFLYSWDGDDYWFEHESYGFAVFRGWEYTSYERLDYLKPVNGLLKIKLAEELEETSYTDSLILKAVEHDPSVEVMPSLDGTIHTISEWVKPSACVDYDGIDCSGLISEDEGFHWRTNFDNKDLSKDEDLRDGLIIEFDKPAGSVSPKLFLRLRDGGFLRMGGEAIIENLGSNNIDYFYNLFSDAPIISSMVSDWRKGIAELIVSVWDGSSWVEAESFGVGSAAWNEVLLSLSNINTETLKIKLESSSGVYLIDEVKVDYSVDQEVRVIELEPVSMTKGEQDVSAILSSDDGERLSLDLGEDVIATYEAIDETPGKSYSYMTDITGYYIIYPPENEVALDLGVYSRVLTLLDPKNTARYVYNKLFRLNLETGLGTAELISSLAMFGLVVLIAAVIALF